MKSFLTFICVDFNKSSCHNKESKHHRERHKHSKLKSYSVKQRASYKPAVKESSQTYLLCT